jgi:phage terminase large subunit-like protein
MTTKTTPSTSKAKSKKGTTEKQPWPQGMPLYRAPDPTNVPGAWFDQSAVDRVVRALRALRHTKGKWAGKPFSPEQWEIDHIIAPIFGWKHPDGTRIRRKAWIEVPRKNGKSTICAALGLVLLAADREPGAEVYSAAASIDQARAVFDEASRMARGAKALRGKLKVLKRAITIPGTAAVWKVLSKVGQLQHGLNVHAAIIDEVHVHKDGGVIEALETGVGAREQPLILYITTADEGDTTGPYEELHSYAIQVANNVVDDESFYSAIWAAADEDDPFDEQTWAKANPNLGVTIQPTFLRDEAKRAKASPAFFASFCRLYLNRRIRIRQRWLALADWDATAGIVDVEKLRGRACYAGLDLASTTDVAALVLVFPMDDETYEVVPYFWVPKDTIAERSTRVPYATWADQGHIEATEGNVIDYRAIRRKLEELAEVFDIKELAYDRWGATQLAQELQDDLGLTVVPIVQGFAGYAASTKELVRVVLLKALRHGGNPVLRWMADNLVFRMDADGNAKPDREKSAEKIDGMVALLMALGRAMLHTEEKEWAFA